MQATFDEIVQQEILNHNFQQQEISLDDFNKKKKEYLKSKQDIYVLDIENYINTIRKNSLSSLMKLGEKITKNNLFEKYPNLRQVDFNSEHFFECSTYDYADFITISNKQNIFKHTLKPLEIETNTFEEEGFINKEMLVTLFNCILIDTEHKERFIYFFFENNLVLVEPNKFEKLCQTIDISKRN